MSIPMIPVPKSLLKTDQGYRLTKALFYEMCYEDPSRAIYTLKDEDVEGKYLSLYKQYMAMEDLAEHNFASTFFDSYEHFENICNLSWFKEHITRWRKELELKVRSRALGNIVEISKDTANKNNYEANKFLLSGNWRGSDNVRNNVGRPTKESIKREAETLFNEHKETEVDYKRVLNG